MNRRSELEAILRDGLKRRLAQYDGKKNTPEVRAQVRHSIEGLFKEYEQEGIIEHPVPKVMVLQHRQKASRFMVLTEKIWKEMCEVGDDEAWNIVR